MRGDWFRALADLPRALRGHAEDRLSVSRVAGDDTQCLDERPVSAPKLMAGTGAEAVDHVAASVALTRLQAPPRCQRFCEPAACCVHHDVEQVHARRFRPFEALEHPVDHGRHSGLGIDQFSEKLPRTDHANLHACNSRLWQLGHMGPDPVRAAAAGATAATAAASGLVARHRRRLRRRAAWRPALGRPAGHPGGAACSALYARRADDQPLPSAVASGRCATVSRPICLPLP